MKPISNIHLYLPRFTYTYEIDLKNILQDLGIISAFSQDKAKFDNIVEGIYLGEFFQKTYIDVNENGTEASEVSVAIFKTNSTGILFKEYYMDVNSSFIYMIQSDEIKDTDNNYLMPFIVL